MKWFKHMSDSHSDMKLRAIVHEFGLVGYAIYWICLELVAQQGSNWTLDGRAWTWYICTMDSNGLELNEVQHIVERLGELGLIDANSLKDGKLYIPKMAKYADNYTGRSLDKEHLYPSTSISSSNNKNINNKDKEIIKEFEILWKQYPNRIGKKDALRHFRASVKTPEDLTNITKALKNYLASDWVTKEGGKYTQLGKTWFYNWEDWVTPPKKEKDIVEKHLKDD